MSQKSKPMNSKSFWLQEAAALSKGSQAKPAFEMDKSGNEVVIIIVAAILFIPRITGNTHISVALAYQKYQQGAFFLDVRSQEEWDQIHIASSTLIPLDELQNRLSELPKITTS